MIVNLTKEEIQDFETSIADDFKNKLIRAPIHLEDNNIPQIIEVFKDTKKGDWFVGSWRFHAESLLAGVPKEELRKAIHEGRSISLCFKDYNVVCSAIVGGNVGIGLGLACDIRRKGQNNHVWVFCGEMTAMTGIFWEAFNYASFWDLPVTFVIADNEKSVLTNTQETWNFPLHPYEHTAKTIGKEENGVWKSKHFYYYKYKLGYPHAGISGARIQF